MTLAAMEKTDAGHSEEISEQSNSANSNAINSANAFWVNHQHHLQSIAYLQLNDNSSAVDDEIKMYLAEPLIALSDCPLKFYYNNKYKNISKIALKYLAVPATSVPCERLFSKVGHILTQERNSLKPNKLNELLFLNSVADQYWD